MPRTARKPLNHIPAHRLSVRIFVCLQDRGDDYDEYGVCVAYVFVHPKGESLQSNGRVFTSGTIIKAGEQLPTQQILSFCQPIVKMVKGWRDTPIFARSDWWNGQKHPVTLPGPVCELIDLIEHFTGTTVISIGNGPRADEIIYIQRAKGSSKGASPAQQRKSPPGKKK
jgi:adenylosuccinate synthase|tara:strand:- start:96 stop:602 length:507 start_codon:yes stop_codon:yes gene_type:complete